MTWQEIAELHRDGFEIGNHTRDHISMTKENVVHLEEQVEAINRQCTAHGITRTTSFAYPGNAISPDALPTLKKLGIRFARRGGAPEYDYREGRGFAYESGLDHPLLIPSAGDARPDWTLENFIAAVEQARHGRIAVLQFHGVPDTAHAWVNTSVEQFDGYMNRCECGPCESAASRRGSPATVIAAVNRRKLPAAEKRRRAPLLAYEHARRS
jgi:peptidoglycan/xylan/chitin deacetylase (PgdA/CDA1 family)